MIADARPTTSPVEGVLLFGEGGLGPARRAGQAVGRARGDRADRAALSAAGRPVAAELGRFPRLRDVRWVQDEPRNMGAWPFMSRSRLLGQVEGRVSLPLTGRHPPGQLGALRSPAPGSSSIVSFSTTPSPRSSGVRVYFTDRGIEELEHRRGDEEVTLAWLADRMRDFVDINPEFEVPVERLATWLARIDDAD